MPSGVGGGGMGMTKMSFSSPDLIFLVLGCSRAVCRSECIIIALYYHCGADRSPDRNHGFSICGDKNAAEGLHSEPGVAISKGAPKLDLRENCGQTLNLPKTWLQMSLGVYWMHGNMENLKVM